MTDRQPCPRPDKQGHRTFQAAMKARAILEATEGIDLALRPYRCVCGSWHLGRRDKTPPWLRHLSGRRLK